MSRVVVVSALPPDAHGTGKAVMWGGLWRHVVRRSGPRATTYVYIGPERVDATDGDYSVRWIRSPRAWEQAWSVARLSLLRDRPFQEAALSSARLRQALHHEIALAQPTTVLVDTYRIAALLRGGRSYRLVMYMDDLFSVRYARMRTALRERPTIPLDPLGNFAALLPRPARALVARPRVRDWLLASEERRVRKTEVEAVTVCDRVLLISPDEAAMLRSLTGADHERVATVPPLVTVGTPRPRTPDPSRPRFVFLGAMNVPHNDVGLTTFLSEAFPSLLEGCPGATLDVIGQGVSERLRAAGTQFGDRVRYLGYVSDLEATLASATAMLVPLVFGSGVKIKVIEALGRGVPVVATSFGAEGVARDIERDDGMRVADDWHAFVAAAEALCDPGANDRASRAARRHYEQHYAPDVVHARYEAVVQ